MTKLEPWPPTPPDDTIMTRQEWLNMGGDYLMDEAEEESQIDQVVPWQQLDKPLLKMAPDEPTDADST